jgi:Phage tail assembly chaperone proteins, E, or 41 or 14
MNERAKIREGFVEDEPPSRHVVEAPRQVEAAPRKSSTGHLAPEIENPPQELPTEEDVSWPIVVKLSFKTIRNSRGEAITEMSFREPTGGDINRYGNPVRMNSTGDWVIEERKMHYVMAALSGHLPPILDQMDPRDWNFCAYELMRFFLPTRRVS